MKDKFIKVFLFVFFGSIAFNIGFSGINALTNYELGRSGMFSGQFTENLLPYLFQIIFILFFISPPIIAVLLFLIWKELRERNKLK